ncbi:MAG: hydrogenase maturation protease [Terriglobia bacterium]|jgi:hydrogenase maturation protease
MRIICCGNRERGDDSAGVLVAERLRELGIGAATCTGEPSEIIEVWSGAADVVVVDAIMTGAPAGTVRLLDARQSIIAGARPASTSTHGFSLADAIGLARTLGRLPQRLRVYGIEGRQFELGTGVSPAVRRAVEKVARLIAAEAEAALANLPDRASCSTRSMCCDDVVGDGST